MKILAAILNLITLCLFSYILVIERNYIHPLVLLVVSSSIISLLALDFFKNRLVRISLRKIKTIIFSRTMAVIAILVLAMILIFSLAIAPHGETKQIYLESFKRVISKDDTYGGSLSPQKIYVSRIVFEDHFNRSNGELISKDVEKEIIGFCDKQGISLVFCDHPNDLKYNELGEIEGGGVLVEFSGFRNFFYFADIEASIHVAGLAAGGTRYKFYRWFSGWIFSSSQMSWIS